MNGPAQRTDPQFELIAGNVCLDFVNTLDDRFSDQPKELLAAYRHLARFAAEAGILPRSQVDGLQARGKESPEPARRALESAIRMREAMSQVFYALVRHEPVPKPALALLNRFAQNAALHSNLVRANEHFEWQFDASRDDLEAPLWPIARSAADLLASDQLQFVRECASNTCRWLFLDESKNHRKRWCDMSKCGNRAKVRNFYQRQRKASA